MRYSLWLAVASFLALAGCNQPSEPISAAADVVAPDPTPAPPKPPEWVYRRKANYREYELPMRDGGAVPGREFEDKLMCQNQFETTDYGVWALKNLGLIDTKPDLTVFAGQLKTGEAVPIGMVIDHTHRVPSFLLIGDDIVAVCEHSVAYP